MEFEEISAKFLPFVKKYWLPLCLALFGLIFFMYGLISLLLINRPQQKAEFSQLQPPSISSETASTITVDVEGAVVSPGVYKLNSVNIVQDALIAAKGLSEQADRNFVSKNINLAAKLIDAQKIYIPFLNEKNSETAQDNTSSVVDSKININTATATQLDTLYGVGLVTAQKIINNRPYVKPEELLEKKVLSAKIFEQIKDKITVY